MRHLPRALCRRLALSSLLPRWRCSRPPRQPPAPRPPGCFGAPGVQCSTVDVPLDRSGTVPGTVRLAVRRVPGRQGPVAGTVMFLAGGPGESALSALPSLSQLVAALLPDHDLRHLRPARHRAVGTAVVRGARRTRAARPPRSTAAAATSSARRASSTARRTRRMTSRPCGSRSARRRSPCSGCPTAAGWRASTCAATPARSPGWCSTRPAPSRAPTRSRSSASRRCGGWWGREICARRACRSFSRGPYRDLSRLALRLRRRGLCAATIYTGSGRRDRGRLTRGGPLLGRGAGRLDPVLRAELPGRGELGPPRRRRAAGARAGAHDRRARRPGRRRARERRDLHGHLLRGGTHGLGPRRAAGRATPAARR